MSILALVLQDQGKYETAEGMSRQALEVREKALGNEHPSSLTRVSNLVAVLRDQGKYEAAEEMDRRAVEGGLSMQVLVPPFPAPLPCIRIAAPCPAWWRQ
ncbi:uncharacterized protein K444DRAFT_197029 [Hyaloscypha bicolor E]|uniref:Kinesin light chain n=1 Tax=Hyaloscypha bicolor E TaxID=1095630 RepID=A0A2J6SQJ0_9HELO|nr:uncharacterized protein K444DRAFT_197029 [Hyaloscypha bicolor E]PMD53038.1 hypothetical protein K444DRAFT_197029 [Hyaloscypha bicolor E]